MFALRARPAAIASAGALSGSCSRTVAAPSAPPRSSGSGSGSGLSATAVAVAAGSGAAATAGPGPASAASWSPSLATTFSSGNLGRWPISSISRWRRAREAGSRSFQWVSTGVAMKIDE